MTNMLQIQKNPFTTKKTIYFFLFFFYYFFIGTVEFFVVPENGFCLKGSQCKKSDLQGLRGTVQCGIEATRIFFLSSPSTSAMAERDQMNTISLLSSPSL